MTRLIDMGVVELLAAFESGQLTPSALVEACLARIEEVDGDTNAVLTLAAEQARRGAIESDRKWRDGTARPLEGIPFGLKDIIDTAGVRTTGGSKLYADRVPKTDAAVVASLRSAGAILLAKLQTYEFAYGGNPHFGPVRNPWNPDRSTGGSSDGPAAALAARELPLTVGSDTGGSIRIPASFCGVTGFKPTMGAVPTTGVMPQAPSFDHVGPMARSARDCAAAFAVMRGGTVTELGGINFEGLKIGVPTNWFFDIIDPEVKAASQACASLFSSLGATIVELEITNAQLSHECFGSVIAPETANSHRSRWQIEDPFGPALAGLVREGRKVAAVDYLEGLRIVSLVREGAKAAFEKCDAILTPGTVCTAPRLDTMLAEIGHLQVPWLDVVARTTLWHNLVGCPAVVLPFGTDSKGLPLSVQLATPPGRDELCLAIADAIQQRTDFHEAQPALG